MSKQAHAPRLTLSDLAGVTPVTPVTPVTTVTVEPVGRVTIPKGKPSTPVTAEQSVANAIAQKAMVETAGAMANAFLDGAKAQEAAKASWETAKLSQLQGLCASLDGAAMVTAEIFDAHMAPAIKAVLLGSGRYTLDAKGQSMAVNTTMASFKAIAIAYTHGLRPLEAHTLVRHFYEASRQFCYKGGYLKAGKGGTGNKTRKATTAKAETVFAPAKQLSVFEQMVSSAMFLTNDDEDMAQRLVTICSQAETMDALDAWMLEQVTPTKANRKGPRVVA
jgi:hypothetical protein